MDIANAVFPINIIRGMNRLGCKGYLFLFVSVNIDQTVLVDERRRPPPLTPSIRGT